MSPLWKIPDLWIQQHTFDKKRADLLWFDAKFSPPCIIIGCHYTLRIMLDGCLPKKCIKISKTWNCRSAYGIFPLQQFRAIFCMTWENKLKRKTIFSLFQEVEFFLTDIIIFHALVQHLIHLFTIFAQFSLLMRWWNVKCHEEAGDEKKTATIKNLIAKKSMHTRVVEPNQAHQSRIVFDLILHITHARMILYLVCALYRPKFSQCYNVLLFIVQFLLRAAFLPRIAQ